MAYSFTFSNGFKYALATKLINFSSDTFNIILMRDGYTFDPDDVRNTNNIWAESLNLLLSASAGSDTFSRATGNFIADGYIPGNQFYTYLIVNPGPFTVVDVATASIEVSEDIVSAGPSAGVGVYSNDELAQINGYTPATLAGVSVTEDDGNNRATVTWNDVEWTAGGGSIGPTPGAIIYDLTADFVLGYLNFDGDKTATVGQKFQIQNIEIRIS